MTPGASREAARGECPTEPASARGIAPAGAARPPLWRLDRRPLDYRAAWALQRDLLRRRQASEVPDLLLLTEHPPVFTLGRTARREHLLFDAAPVVGGTAEGPEGGTGGGTGGAEVVETDRGGDVTFHGPGQLVAYPIVALSAWKKDVRAWLRLLEAAVIRAAADFGVPAGRRPGVTGVFCPPDGEDPASGRGRPSRKLAAIGVRVSRWVTSHGVAVNANTDLRWFDRIVPCGLRDAETTSLAAELGRPVVMERLADALAAAVAAELGRELRPAPMDWKERFPGAAAPDREDASRAALAPLPLPPLSPPPGPGPPPGRRPTARRPRNAPEATAA